MNARPPLIAVVIPFFQRKEGLLAKALHSIFEQTLSAGILPIVVDDESPVPARTEIAKMPEGLRERTLVIEQKNGGAGSARNRALNHVPAGTRFVAFLDSDDTWRPGHLENAIRTLEAGYDAYFSDWWSYNYPETTNFERIGSLKPEGHQTVKNVPGTFELGVTPIQHILSDGGGVIQTSTVVYRYEKFPDLRFREEFYNGQDFFFWMDLGERGANFVFSTSVDADNGEGINIYQGAGWGTERSLQRLRNELFVWTSVNRFYALTPEQRAANKKTIRNLQQGVVRDVMYRLRRNLPISRKLLGDIVRFDPSFLAIAPLVPLKVLAQRLAR